MTNNKYTPIRDANFIDCLNNAEIVLRNLVSKAARIGRTGTISAADLAIQAGRGLSSVRCAKHMLKLPTLEPRTAK